MEPAARRALAVVRRCIETEHFALTLHFRKRKKERGLFWSDVEAAIQDAHEARSPSADRFGRPTWIISGQATNGDEIDLVCAIEIDESEAEFITLYWSD